MRVITRISQHKIQFQLCRITGLNRSVSGAIRGKIQRPEAPRRPHRSQPGGLRNQRPGPSALPTSPLARPVHKQAGSWTGCLRSGGAGRDGSRCCCSGCRRCSCSGSKHACSPVCCTKNRIGSHAGRLLARSLVNTAWEKIARRSPSVSACWGMAHPTLSRGHDLGPVQTPSSIGLRHCAKSAGEAVAVIVSQPAQLVRIYLVAEKIEPIDHTRHMRLAGMKSESVGREAFTNSRPNVCQACLVMVQYHHINHVVQVGSDT